VKTILSNWRELLIGVLLFVIVSGLLVAMGDKAVAENPVLSLVVSGLLSLLMGALKFACACTLAWFGLSVTFPEANRFVVGSGFDLFWQARTLSEKGAISLGAAGVLAIVAGLCMAS
jgi:uncharacterized membrane protein HdeD (DUF308 family)